MSILLYVENVDALFDQAVAAGGSAGYLRGAGCLAAHQEKLCKQAIRLDPEFGNPYN